MTITNIVTKNGIKVKVALPVNNTALPLLIFLMGIGQRGNDIEVADDYGPLLQAKNGADFPFIIATPLLPAGHSFSTTFIDEVMEHVKSNYQVDEDRISLGGYSFGGLGTFNYLQNIDSANKLSCAFVIAPGAADPGKVKAIVDSGIPMWAVHGTSDTVVHVSKTLAMVKAINGLSGKYQIRFDPWVGMSHSIANKFLEGKLVGSETIYPVYDWMLYQRKSARKLVDNSVIKQKLLELAATL